MKKAIYILIFAFVIVLVLWFGIRNTIVTNDAQLLSDLNNGIYLGYIHSVDVDSYILAFDNAMWLTGTEAQDAAIEAGHCTESNRSECTPNDYFIKNEKVLDESVTIDQNANVFMQTWKIEETGIVAEFEIGLSDFAELINDKSLRWRMLPYNITIQNGKVIKIEEVYIP